MPVIRPRQLLVVEDEQPLAEMLEAYFQMRGYVVQTAFSGQQALALANKSRPDLILLDIRLPDIDGFVVADRLQKSHVTRGIPIVFLTERHERDARHSGLKLGAYDYITKPFDVEELWLRIRNIIKRTEKAGSEHPVTGLPENAYVDDVLRNVLNSGSEYYAVLVASLRGLIAFRELYGFVASNEVLNVTGRTLAAVVDEIGGPYGFCGHLDEHTFLIAAPIADLDVIQIRIEQRLQNALEYFYPADNRGDKAHTSDRLRVIISRLPEFTDSTRNFTLLREDVIALSSQKIALSKAS